MDATTFWSRVDRSEGCWLWTGSRDNNGYGTINLGQHRRYDRAHRLSWIYTNGSIPDGLSVLHRCDVPACVRPDHLFLGDQRANMADMARKGRHWLRSHPERAKRGSANPSARLTESQVVAIRAAYAAGGVTQRQLAREYGITQHAIWYVLKGGWRHLS